jgi:RNA polymerase sigma factor (sigma-70 family)
VTTTDETGFHRIYRTFQPELTAYFLRRVDPDDVQDLTEDVFTVAWRRRHDVPQGREALMWLYGVARNVLSHHQRSKGRRIRLNARLGGLSRQESADLDLQVVRRLEYEQVLEAASRLRFGDQEVLRLALWEGLTHQEIAGITGVSVSAVKQRYHRAKRRLTREYQHISHRQTVPAATRKGGDD